MSSNTEPIFALYTLGCAKNEVDSAKMKRALETAGYAETNQVEDAKVIVINTCSFITPAIEESISTILEIANLDSVQANDTRLVVTGCMPSRFGDDLSEALPEIDAFVPCADEGSIVDVCDKVIQRNEQDARTKDYLTSLVSIDGALAQSERVSNYVKIGDGCNRFCAFCAIPYIRGRYHSFPFETIYNDVEQLVEQGTREIVLIAQDTGRWGSDFEEKLSLSWLLEKLAPAFPDTWFRIMYVEPEGVTDELLATMAAHPNICHYIDVPFQHASASVIERMNRRGDKDEYLSIIKRIRKAMPDAVIRTTIMTGFPGETSEDFEVLCDFIEESDLDYIGVFEYSQEEGTAAFELPHQVDEDTKRERAQQLRDLADAVCIPRVDQRVGKKFDVLICGMEEDGQVFGRTYCQAPEVDGVCYLEEGQLGEIKQITVENTLLYEMEGA